MNLPQLPQDKANHFIYGAFIHLFTSLLFQPLPSLFIVASVAFFKEFFDTYSVSKFSIWDFVATVFGGALILAAQYVA